MYYQNMYRKLYFITSNRIFWFGSIFKTVFSRFARQSDINTDIKTVLLFYMDRVYLKHDNVLIALCH